MMTSSYAKIPKHGQLSIFWIPIFQFNSLNNIFQDSFNKILYQQLTHDRSYISHSIDSLTKPITPNRGKKKKKLKECKQETVVIQSTSDRACVDNIALSRETCSVPYQNT